MWVKKPNVSAVPSRTNLFIAVYSKAKAKYVKIKIAKVGGTKSVEISRAVFEDEILLPN